MQIRWLTGPPDELNLLLFAPPPQAWSQSWQAQRPELDDLCGTALAGIAIVSSSYSLGVL